MKKLILTFTLAFSLQPSALFGNTSPQVDTNGWIVYPLKYRSQGSILLSNPVSHATILLTNGVVTADLVASNITLMGTNLFNLLTNLQSQGNLLTSDNNFTGTNRFATLIPTNLAIGGLTVSVPNNNILLSSVSGDAVLGFFTAASATVLTNLGSSSSVVSNSGLWRVLSDGGQEHYNRGTNPVGLWNIGTYGAAPAPTSVLVPVFSGPFIIDGGSNVLFYGNVNFNGAIGINMTLGGTFTGSGTFNGTHTGYFTGPGYNMLDSMEGAILASSLSVGGQYRMISSNGNVTAVSFTGDGSGLTGIPSASYAALAGTASNLVGSVNLSLLTNALASMICSGTTNIPAASNVLAITLNGHIMPSTNYVPSVSVLGARLAVTNFITFTARTPSNFTANFTAPLGAANTNLAWSVIYAP
jgi:hypothetical protein